MSPLPTSRPHPQQNSSYSVSPEDLFEQRVRQIIRPDNRVLDAGCGAGKFFSFGFARDQGCRIVGLDSSPNLLFNGGVDARVHADLSQLPFPDEVFDVVNCRLVIEHLKVPLVVLQEFYRALKPRGRIAIFTPNLLHYFGMAAKYSPLWFHLWFNSRFRQIEEADVFPTQYRANTRAKLDSLLRRAGFHDIDISLVEGDPSVLAFSSPLYRLGMTYKHMVERFESLSSFRLNIIAVAYKA